MPRLIFKCPYIKGGTSSATAHLENYVKYMATRNGVERIDPGRSEWPATSKQKKMVEQILRDFPLSRGMFEYEDYAAEPTRTNASEFITRALEDNYNQIAKKDNYLKYIATRPRAQRVGSHGLFTGEEDQLVLAQVAEAVAAHPGNVWLPIISLRREDAARLGYDIINLPHPTSAKHPRMPLSDRAAQFAPFAALSGHSAALVETARLTDQRMELDEDARAALDSKQQLLLERIKERPEITVTWFQPDAKKDGGRYIVSTGRLKRIHEADQVLILVDGLRIPIGDIVELESECIRGLL